MNKYFLKVNKIVKYCNFLYLKGNNIIYFKIGLF